MVENVDEKSKSSSDDDDDRSMLALSSGVCTSGKNSTSLNTDSSLKYAKLSLNKQTICEMNGYSLPNTSSSSGLGSSVSGSSSSLLAPFEVNARSKKGRLKKQTNNGKSKKSNEQIVLLEKKENGRPLSLFKTESPPPTYSQIFNGSNICTNAAQPINFNCTDTQLHLDSPATNDTHYVNQVTHGGQLKTEGGCYLNCIQGTSVFFFSLSSHSSLLTKPTQGKTFRH